MSFRTTDRCLPACVASAMLLVSCAGVPVFAVQFAAARSYPARGTRAVELSSWEQAERTRDAYETVPEAERTPGGYTRVLDKFRAIYHEHPGDLHAAEAVNAVAELLAEEGRGQRDAGLLRAAVKQYEFLRTQYPGSSMRVGALLAEAQIEQNDLHDAAVARERYTSFLTEYPRSGMAEEARAGLASLDASAAAAPVRDRGVALVPQQALSSAPTTGTGVAAEHPVQPLVASGAAVAAEAAGAPIERRVHHPTGAPAMVTGIRHWSTPSYTRVAIDLGSAVEYEAARVPGPDRIYFDLHGARLAQDLVGKSFAVTDDGFLKRIRVAQSGGDLARIVLDVNDVTEYSAFLLPNPYRLIIDIHGRSKPAGVQVATMDAPARPAAGVPNTRAVNAGSATEVTRLSEQPGKVEATTVPTSQPISAVVAGNRGLPAMASTAAAGTPAIASASVANGLGGGGAASSPALVASGTAPLPVNSLAASTRKGRRTRVVSPDARVVGDPATPARVAVKTADGQTSLVRALGLKINRIVIDAGHGGHDSGTIGVDGLEEKDVVLDVALRLGKLLHERLGAEVIYTRSDDTFIPLETRTAIANKAQADLFLSIHANSSPEPSARGVETYYLNFTAQPDALEVAARENAVSGQSVHQLSDLVKKITLKDKIAESREFATDVEGSLYGGLARGNEGLKDRGVKKAPFVVLIGANMPSVLAEISFVTNPRDAGELRQPEYRERVAESLFKGVARYAGGLSGTAAGAVERASGQ